MATKTYETYVDLSPDLAAAWEKIQSDPDAWDSQYWIKRGATSKKTFGQAHATEDMQLKLGSYTGDTKFTKGSEGWNEIFTSREGQFGTKLNYPGPLSTPDVPLTRWEEFNPQVATNTQVTTNTVVNTNTETVETVDTSDSGSTQATVEQVSAPVVQEVVTQTPDLASLTNEMDLSNKLTEIIDKNSPLFKAASTKALQNMAKRGIVNSSMAQESVMNAILQVAMPIAQNEVQNLITNLYYNTDWTNKDKLLANEAAYNKMLSQVQGQINHTLQRLVGSQNIGLQNLKGAQAMDLQQLIGQQSLTVSQQKIKGELWSKYGDWVTEMATTEGADQAAWQRMLDLLKGAGGWPQIT